MKLTIFNLLFITVSLFGQSSPEEKISLMKNSLLMGIEEKGLIECSEILSFDQYKTVREEALFTVSEYYFATGIMNDQIEIINKAYTFYLKCLNEYPHGTYNKIITLRKNYLESNFRLFTLFRDLSNYSENERIIVEKKLSLPDVLVTTSEPFPFLFFGEGSNPKVKPLLDKYFDDIIVNNELYSIHAYYMKLLSTLSQSYNVKIFTSDMDWNTYQVNGYKDVALKKEVFDILESMKTKFPKHPLTSQAYLVAVSYLIKADALHYKDKETKELLEYVLLNEEDKLSLRFLITKEFLLKTKFQD